MNEVPRQENGSYYTCAYCRLPIEDDFAERDTGTPGLRETVHGRCKTAKPISVEIDEHGGKFDITLVNGNYRCSRCDDHDRETGMRPSLAGVGQSETDWKRHVDTAHRSRGAWKYGNWYQTFS